MSPFYKDGSGGTFHAMFPIPEKDRQFGGFRNHAEEIAAARAASEGSIEHVPTATVWPEHARDPLDDAATNMHAEIADIHDLLRAAKADQDQSRQIAIFRRCVELEGFLKALVIDARSGLDALKELL